jgi:hypothetical protein
MLFALQKPGAAHVPDGVRLGHSAMSASCPLFLRYRLKGGRGDTLHLGQREAFPGRSEHREIGHRPRY